MQGTRAHQRGLSLLGMLVTGVALAYLAIIAAKVAPSVSEYFTIQKAVDSAAQDGTTPAAVRQSFDRRIGADYANAISGKDLEVVRVGDQMRVHFAYEKEVLLGGPLYLLIKYQGESKAAAPR